MHFMLWLIYWFLIYFSYINMRAQNYRPPLCFFILHSKYNESVFCLNVRRFFTIFIIHLMAPVCSQFPCSHFNGFMLEMFFLVNFRFYFVVNYSVLWGNSHFTVNDSRNSTRCRYLFVFLSKYRFKIHKYLGDLNRLSGIVVALKIFVKYFIVSNLKIDFIA